ncbi:ALF repeat-containing protein [Streptomyces sp. NBC_00885]|nr:ALF repeat-containing protein [Streptomyces sp. NBC_00885]
MATSGKAVTKAGNAALTDGSPAALEKFLTTDQFTARLEDMRVEASKLLMLAGPEVQKYANRALSGTEAEVSSRVPGGVPVRTRGICRSRRSPVRHDGQGRKSPGDADQKVAVLGFGGPQRPNRHHALFLVGGHREGAGVRRGREHGGQAEGDTLGLRAAALAGPGVGVRPYPLRAVRPQLQHPVVDVGHPVREAPARTGVPGSGEPHRAPGTTGAT